MKTFEKPFEHLVGKEKEVIDLCAEIVRWSIPKESNDPLFGEKAKLREHATQLYETLGKMDFDYDDKYYKIYEQTEVLRKEYEELKNFKTGKDNEVDFVNEETGSLIKTILESVKEDNSISIKQWSPDVGGYGDYVSLDVSKKNGQYRIFVDELWDYDVHKSRPHIEQIKEKYNFTFKTDFGSRLHDFASAYQISFIIENIPSEKIAEVSEFVIESIKSTPRIRK